MNIATWNICLGLKNKKETIYEYLKEKNIKICALQEVEIAKDYNHQLLSSKEYKIEIESTKHKARNATLIHNTVNYERKKELEEEDNSIVIIDVNMSIKLRIINIYRSCTLVSH